MPPLLAAAVLNFVALAVDNVWLAAALYLYMDRIFHTPPRPLLKRLCAALKWPALASILIQPVLTIVIAGKGDPVFWTVWAINLLLWWLFRNEGDDDSWKKYRDRIAAKIVEINGRLIIRPEPA